MLYSYTITKKFLEELSQLEFNLSSEICNFIINSFIKKENLYLKIDRSILTKKYGLLSNDKLDSLLKKLSRETKDVLINKNIPIDFALVGIDEKKGISNINCNLILKDQEKIEEEINEKIVDFWHGEDSQKNLRKLESHIKRILIFNNKLILNYRYILITLIDKKIIEKKIESLKLDYKKSNELKKAENDLKVKNYQLSSYKLFLKFITNLRNNIPAPIKINSVLSRRHQEDANKISFDYKEELTEFFKYFLKKNDEIIVRDGTDYIIWKYSHARLIISLLDNPETDEEVLGNDLNIFDIPGGLQLFKKNFSIIKGNEIVRKVLKSSLFLWKNDVKHIENANELVAIKTN